MTLSSIFVSRLEKAAVDNGFDQEQRQMDDWLAFSSTHCSLRIWLTSRGDKNFCAALSQENVVRSLEGWGLRSDSSLPQGAVACLIVSDVPALHSLLRRAFQLAKTLPDELLHAFELQTARLPKSTEAERLVIQRVGQEVFRKGLIEYWEGRCAMTGLDVTDLLRASHIKPWAECDSDAERLDVFNGLLLAPHLDALFDKGFITVQDSGSVEISSRLSSSQCELLGIGAIAGVVALEDEHKRYLQYHRNMVFK